MSDDVTREDVTPEVLDELERLLANSTPGAWKVWGMQVLADVIGDSDVNHATSVALTHHTDAAGRPRTWDADLIALMQRSLPALIAAARQVRAAEEAQRVAEERAERAEAALTASERDLLNRDERIATLRAGSIRYRAALARVEALCRAADGVEQESIVLSPGRSTFYVVEVGRIRAALKTTRAVEHCDECGMPITDEHTAREHDDIDWDD